MPEPKIVDRGDGPKIEGTRITVYTVLEDLRNGHTRDEIAVALDLSSRQVQAAIDYIRANEDAVNVEYDKIVARIRQGNPPPISNPCLKRTVRNSRRGSRNCGRTSLKRQVDDTDHVRQRRAGARRPSSGNLPH